MVEKIKVYTYCEEACGAIIIEQNPKHVLEAAELFMQESGDGAFTITIDEMEKSELEALPEFDGC